MARTDAGVTVHLQIRRDETGTWKLRSESFDPPKDDDPETSGIQTYSDAYTPSGTRDLTSEELTGTLSAFLTARLGAWKTANGIA